MLLRRLRGVLVAALVWAVLWLPLGVAVGVLRYLNSPPFDLISDEAPERLPALPIIATTAGQWSLWGAVVGIVFALVLLGAERTRTIEDLSPWRMASWGGLAAIALPLILVLIDAVRYTNTSIGWQFVTILAVTGAFGAACSAGMLGMARRASVTTKEGS